MHSSFYTETKHAVIFYTNDRAIFHWNKEAQALSSM